MRTPKHLQNPNYKRQQIGASHRRPESINRERTVFYDDTVSLWAWPSRGGLIVLQNVTALDISFLGLDSLNLPEKRDENQEKEDEFCQQLLRIGAKWFDSRARCGFVANVFDDNEPELSALEQGEAADLTLMERRWIKVGWPSTGGDGFWVAEYDTVLYKVLEPKNLVPSGAGQVDLARTMDEKCEILQKLGAKYFTSIQQYDGEGCLNAWETKTTGEVGPLVKYQ